MIKWNEQGRQATAISYGSTCALIFLWLYCSQISSCYEAGSILICKEETSSEINKSFITLAAPEGYDLVMPSRSLSCVSVRTGGTRKLLSRSWISKWTILPHFFGKIPYVKYFCRGCLTTWISRFFVFFHWNFCVCLWCNQVIEWIRVICVCIWIRAFCPKPNRLGYGKY